MLCRVASQNSSHRATVQVCHIADAREQVKRQMYGRAKFDLLRKQVLAT